MPSALMTSNGRPRDPANSFTVRRPLADLADSVRPERQTEDLRGAERYGDNDRGQFPAASGAERSRLQGPVTNPTTAMSTFTRLRRATTELKRGARAMSSGGNSRSSGDPRIHRLLARTLAICIQRFGGNDAVPITIGRVTRPPGEIGEPDGSSANRRAQSLRKVLDVAHRSEQRAIDRRLSCAEGPRRRKPRTVRRRPSAPRALAQSLRHSLPRRRPWCWRGAPAASPGRRQARCQRRWAPQVGSAPALTPRLSLER